MEPQTFIEERLNNLNSSEHTFEQENATNLEAEILRLLLFKKFRKYSASEELINHCKKAISIQVSDNKPINITFLHGAYKLWRLEESPCVDWAEFFSLLYYTDWVKGICKIYKPGVWFDFFVDDLIVPKLDNIPMNDVEKYIESYNQLINFIKFYQPKNLKMTITPVGSKFKSAEEFEDILKQKLNELNRKSNNQLPKLTDSQRAMIELNVKLNQTQKKDPTWQEKIWQLHNAYLEIKKSLGYHFRPEKILAFTQPLPSGSTISVGTTKSSIMKFWIGAGVLKPRDTSYQEVIFSPSQLKSADFQWLDMKIKGLNGENFEKIRILK